MKNPHEMTRLELEKEVFDSRTKIQQLESKIVQQKHIINIYGSFIDDENSKKLIKKK